MLEYFSSKKDNKHLNEKSSEQVKSGKKVAVQSPPPLINEEDERFLERIVSAEGTPPPLPTRPTFGAEAGSTAGNASQIVVHDNKKDEKHHRGRHHNKGKGKEQENEKPGEKNEKSAEANKDGRFSGIASAAGFLRRSISKRAKSDLKPKKIVSTPEAVREEDDLTSILDDLDLTAQNNRAFSLSAESQELVRKFTVILKDIVNGVPTAYHDLVHLLDSSQGTLSKNYEKMPSFLQKLIAQLPDKLTMNLAPELLAVATEAQALSSGAAATGGVGISSTAKNFFTPSTLKDLVTKPGAVASVLKAIMNALKLRWPAFMGTNVLLSLGLFVLLFFFWYCHKRGREVRIERENAPIDSNGRIVDLSDDPAIAGPSTTHYPTDGERLNDYDREEHERDERRKERRRLHELEKERNHERDEDERPHHSRHASGSSRPSNSRHGSTRLKADDRDRDGRRSRSSRESRESRESRGSRR